MKAAAILLLALAVMGNANAAFVSKKQSAEVATANAEQKQQESQPKTEVKEGEKQVPAASREVPAKTEPKPTAKKPVAAPVAAMTDSDRAWLRRASYLLGKK